MQIIEVNSEKTARAFIHMAPKLYQEDAHYIRPLDADVDAVFNPEKNMAFQDGGCKRWLLLGDNDAYIGRIAAFYTKDTKTRYEQPTGACGFFECINDQKAANLLFDTAKSWLQEQGLQAMDGPVNFGDRDKWWGLLVDGFYEPCYQCNYNPPYYQDLFESYGFEVYFKQYTYWRRISEPLDTKYAERAKRILENRGYSFGHADLNDLEKAARDFRQVYNEAWARHEGIGELSEEQTKALLSSMRPILDPNLIWFTYFNNKPVGFFVSIPDINQLIVKHVKGKLSLWGKLLFLFRKKRKLCKTIFGIVFGVSPQHQKKGVEIAMIVESAKLLQDKKAMKYKELQMNWIGDFNPKMMRVAENIGAKIYKTHHTYRYLFDREQPFTRYPIL